MALKDIIEYRKDMSESEIFNKLWDLSAQTDALFLEVKDGNDKLKPGNGVIYIVWNLPYMITCPGATEACKLACYAANPEKRFRANTVPYRYNNLVQCTGDNAETFVSRMIHTIEDRLSRNAYKSKAVRVRIHESGDFFSREYAMMWLEIARHFEGLENLVFMAYTKSFGFFDGIQLPNNFVLRASIWQDTPEKDIETIKRNSWPVYMAVPSNAIERFVSMGFILCTCENCSTCKDHCFTRQNKNMVVALHGQAAKKLENDIPRLLAIAEYLTGKKERAAA